MKNWINGNSGLITVILLTILSFLGAWGFNKIDTLEDKFAQKSEVNRLVEKVDKIHEMVFEIYKRRIE